MIITIVGLVIGILILGAGILYSVKEKHDAEAVKMYRIAVIAGIIIIALMILRFFLL
ncbi:MAG: hypothetical protein ACK5MN_11580 [Lachnospiraceae bacterium]